MTTVLLVRHGETEWNVTHRLQGWAPVPLSEQGREQAAKLGPALTQAYDIDHLVASDLPRANETAELIASEIGVAVTRDERWRERDFGVLQGMTYEELDDRHPEYSLVSSGESAVEARPERGESLVDLRDRVLEAWNGLVAEAGPNETHLVVTHGGPIYLLLGSLLDRDIVEAVLESSQGNCAVNEVRVDGAAAEVVRENDTALFED